MSERLDLIIFGATGFTGLHCIPYVHKLSKSNGRNLSWGVSGRSEQKLKDVLKNVGKDLGVELDSIPIIIADVNDEESLLNMAKRARVVVNCTGPYRFFGEAVVKACLEAATHHIDVSGEPEYMERMELKYHETAVKKGVYAISACGMDSIPNDLGVVFVEQEFDGTLNSVESFLTFGNDVPVSGPAVNYGTWHTMVESLANINELAEVRKKIFAKKLPKFEPRLPLRKFPHRPKLGSGWAVPFPGADAAVVRRTQRYLYEAADRRPVQAGVYLVVKNTLELIGLIIFGLIFATLAKFSFGRKLLLDYPEFFSWGRFSKKPPSEKMIKTSWVNFDFYGEGWKEKLASKDDQYTTPVDSYIIARVKGRNPGYGATCVAAVLSAIVVLTETDKLPGKGKGGIYPPGAAFTNTSLVKQLNETGDLTFEIIDKGDLPLKSKM